MSQAGIVDVEQSHPQIPTMFVTNSGPGAVPIANVLELLATIVAAHGIPIQTTGSGNTVTVQTQYASAAATSVGTNAGLASFNSADFTVDANGFVTLIGGPVVTETLTGNSGGAVSPTSNNINIVGTGSITIVGNPGTSTLTTQLTGLTNHAVQVGAGTATLTQIAVGATNTVLLGNTGADPSFGAVPNAALVNSSVTLNNGNNITVTGGTPLALGGTASFNLTGTTNHAVQIGNAGGSLTSIAVGSTGQVLQANTGADPTWSTATYPSTTTINQILYSSSNNVVSGLATANNGVLTTGATGTPAITALSANGQLIIGSASGPPLAATLTAGTGVTITNAANSITIAVTGGTITTETLTGNSGGAVSPTAGNINTVGTGSITIVGSPGTNTLTTQLTGLTNHAVLVGAGTATITSVGPTATVGQVLQSAGSLADPAFSTATYPLTTTINQILFSSATNTVTGLATANNATLTTGATGVPVLTPLAVNGQVLIGSGSGPPLAATLTAGTGITITNAANSITIAANAAAPAYTNVTHAMSPYTVLTTDEYISVDCSAGVVSLLFPNVPTAKQTWTVKDRTGNASTNNISITTVGGSVTIDGQTTYKIISNWGAINLLANATPTYEVY